MPPTFPTKGFASSGSCGFVLYAGHQRACCLPPKLAACTNPSALSWGEAELPSYLTCSSRILEKEAGR